MILIQLLNALLDERANRRNEKIRSNFIHGDLYALEHDSLGQKNTNKKKRLEKWVGSRTVWISTNLQNHFDLPYLRQKFYKRLIFNVSEKSKRIALVYPLRLWVFSVGRMDFLLLQNKCSKLNFIQQNNNTEDEYPRERAKK